MLLVDAVMSKMLQASDRRDLRDQMNNGGLQAALEGCMQHDDAALLQGVHEYEQLEMSDLAELMKSEDVSEDSRFNDPDLQLSLVPKIRSLGYQMKNEPDIDVDQFACISVRWVDEVLCMEPSETSLEKHEAAIQQKQKGPGLEPVEADPAAESEDLGAVQSVYDGNFIFIYCLNSQLIL